MKKQKVTILGSTWSIWTQTLEVIREHSKYFEVYALSANSNIGLLEEQIREFKPKKVVVFDKEKYKELDSRLRGNDKYNSGNDKNNVETNNYLSLRNNIVILQWMPWLVEISEDKNTDILVTAVVWAIWFEPTKAALKKWKVIALANKETMVCAWEEINKLLKKHWWEIRPIDSEHSAIWQALRSWEKKEIKKIWLTASGWPFRDFKIWTKDKIAKAKAKDALKHPTWNMWAKITIDSATLANKGLEFIEAMYLFDLKPEQIEVVIHQQSIIHSAIEYQDWSIIAELWATDMCRAISYALLWWKRLKNNFRTFSFFDKNLTFEKPDLKRFPCLYLAIQAAKHSQKACKIFNDVNEIAVQKYLKWEIGFYDISNMIWKELNKLIS